MADLNTDLKSVRSRNLEPKTRLMYESTKSMFATAITDFLNVEIENIHPDQRKVHEKGILHWSVISRSHIILAIELFQNKSFEDIFSYEKENVTEIETKCRLYLCEIYLLNMRRQDSGSDYKVSFYFHF